MPKRGCTAKWTRSMVTVQDCDGTFIGNEVLPPVPDGKSPPAGLLDPIKDVLVEIFRDVERYSERVPIYSKPLV